MDPLLLAAGPLRRIEGMGEIRETRTEERKGRAVGKESVWLMWDLVREPN